MSAYSDWKCGALSDDEFVMNRLLMNSVYLLGT